MAIPVLPLTLVSSLERRLVTSVAEARQAQCRGTMKALNAQFAQWVAERAVASPFVSWAKGCEDYLKHLNGIKVRRVSPSVSSEMRCAVECAHG